MISGIDDILAGYESLRAGQEALYKDLLQRPELSRAEHRTARRVAEQLRKLTSKQRIRACAAAVVSEALARSMDPRG